MNYIKFKVGDVVCVKDKYMSPIGKVTNDLQNISPLQVMVVIEDADWNNRIGEKGCAHQYRLKNLIHGRTFLLYQYELEFWSKMKDKVIRANKEYIEQLEYV